MQLFFTEKNVRRKRIKKRNKTKHFLDTKIKYLSKLNQKLKERNEENMKNLQNNSVKPLKKSHSVFLFENNPGLFMKNNSCKNIFVKVRLPKMNYSEKKDLVSSNYNDDNPDTNGKSILELRKMKLLKINQCRRAYLPKIKDNIISTMKNSKIIEKDLFDFKLRRKEMNKVRIQPKNEKTNKEININSLLNVSPRKVFKLLFGKNNSRQQEKPFFKIKLKSKNKNQSNIENISKYSIINSSTSNFDYNN